MATFFVHDLKNAANSLTLLLENMPRHFDDPEFREDALRAIGKTVDRINTMIQRLGSLQRKPEINRVESDLNELVVSVLEELPAVEGRVEIVRELRPLPKIWFDPEQMGSVVTNLVVNAREAVGSDGVVRVETMTDAGQVVLSVQDDGCGMSPEFVEKSLFKPFCTTKSKGLGIGMFQCRMVVEAHRGRIRVESAPGDGTTFRVNLPVG
jgi:signal transduction histidine kinase